MTRNHPNPSRPQATAVRCAVYTRKSSEEGLEQEFNSLDAQRESGEAYIASQKNEGWSCLRDRYDDGGFTGGNMDRPAVRRLMADIEAGKIDCVVVYKVDRLSRSLMDFARMIGTFEKHKVSFVSVTQQFNTGSSMGRLVLNVLLSFAQFEREIISERTRDKIAATRRKGKWAGGHPILGYDIDPRGFRLVVNEDEATRVREIFALYLEHQALIATVLHIAGCVRALSTEPAAFFGVDLAKSVDWTVVIGCDARGRVCMFERWQNVPWEATVNKILGLVGEGPTLVDSTGVGDPIAEALHRRAPNIEGFKFTAISRQQLMEGLALAIQQREVGFPEGIIRLELESFEYQQTRSGVRYAAPEGQHDDAAVALALAVRRACSAVVPGVSVVYHQRPQSPEEEELGTRTWFEHKRRDLAWGWGWN